MHPSNRSERRHVREVWRNYRRFIMFNIYSHQSTDNGGWDRGGKQYCGCGNRCQDSMLKRFEHHQEVKRLRRKPIDFVEIENFISRNMDY